MHVAGEQEASAHVTGPEGGEREVEDGEGWKFEEDEVERGADGQSIEVTSQSCSVSSQTRGGEFWGWGMGAAMKARRGTSLL